MLLTNLYTIQEHTVQGDIQTAAITLNPTHPVFTGHFPDRPVTPGVCMLQIIKELTEERIGVPLFMKKVTNVKFMAVINPEETPNLTIINTFVDTAHTITVKNTFQYGETIALKVTVTFEKIAIDNTVEI